MVTSRKGIKSTYSFVQHNSLSLVDGIDLALENRGLLIATGTALILCMLPDVFGVPD